MNPVEFPECNCRFGPPPGLAETQVMPVAAFSGHVQGGSVDGAHVVVTAWKPTDEEIELIKLGRPIFLSFLGGLPPHSVTMDFRTATHPQ